MKFDELIKIEWLSIFIISWVIIIYKYIFLIYSIKIIKGCLCYWICDINNIINILINPFFSFSLLSEVLTFLL